MINNPLLPNDDYTPTEDEIRRAKDTIQGLINGTKQANLKILKSIPNFYVDLEAEIADTLAEYRMAILLNQID